MKEKFSIIGDLRNDRFYAEYSEFIEIDKNPPIKKELDIYELIIDKSEVVAGKDLPSIKRMLEELSSSENI